MEEKSEGKERWRERMKKESLKGGRGRGRKYVGGKGKGRRGICNAEKNASPLYLKLRLPNFTR